uniref:Si:ch1073-291c23.2 n=1 Tax=Hucho hucho TaxID=62062 RepID=A0A4W5RA48_9TELE
MSPKVVKVHLNMMTVLCHRFYGALCNSRVVFVGGNYFGEYLMMSVNMVSDISPAGGIREPHTTTLGGSKPLHRFIRGEPKSIGIVMLFMGSSLFILAIPMRMDPLESSAENFTSFWLGILFIICGLLYVLTEKNTSKQLVTASLALSIISILGVTVAFFEFLKSILNMQFYRYHYYHSYYDDNITDRVDVPWRKHHTGQLLHLEAVFMYQSLVGMVLLIMMTAFARAALRSSKTQAIVVMNTLPSAD